MKEFIHFFESEGTFWITRFSFLFFALMTIVGAAILLISQKVMYAAFGLLVSFLGVAGIYVFAGADFLAVTQIMVYVGGILVLLIFGVMLVRDGEDDIKEVELPLSGLLSVLAFFAFLLLFLLEAQFKLGVGKQNQPLTSTVKSFGIAFVTDYVLLFELIGILLLIALMGAIYVARTSKNKEK
ncbi:MAG: NADH-quinone oxidoreductase subunit J [Spirosomataceae bacterium]